jgi:phage terminase small subunit
MLTLISETHAPEEIYRDIAAHFTEKEMVDLTIAIGLMNVFNRIAIGFGCDPASRSSNSKQEMSHDCDEKRDRQPRRRGSAR